jgi:GNAT superfamily N-acetyltransferase
MSALIRRATIQDLKDVQSLNLLLFKKEAKEFEPTLDCNWTFSKEGEDYLSGRITGTDSCVFVACVGEQIIGYLAGALTEKESYRILPIYAELENMFVLDAFRGQGVGTKLCQAFLEWCKTKGVGRLKVEASAANTESINFYRKNGFVDSVLVLESILP